MGENLGAKTGASNCHTGGHLHFPAGLWEGDREHAVQITDASAAHHHTT